MTENMKRFLALPACEKKLVLEAFTTLGIFRFAMTIVPFKRIVRSLAQQKNIVNLPDLSGAELKTAITIGACIEKTANNTPWKSACLVQALTAARMLRRRNIPGAVYIGVMRSLDSGAATMEAHAWTRCGDSVVTGGNGHESFTVMTVLQWH